MFYQRCTASILGVALTIGGLFPAMASASETWPNKAVTVVVGYAAGGPTDILMRAMAPVLAQEWRVPVVVENRPGTNEVIAAQAISKAQPDGYHLLLSTEAPLTQNQHLFRKLPYNAESSFSPITHILTSPLALVVHPKVEANNVQEFIELAKARSATKPLAYGSAGAGGVLHLPMAMFAKENGLDMLHVPYKGLAPLISDLLGEHVDASWMAVAAAAPYVETGKLKALVLAAPERSKSMPNVPVFAETEIDPVQANFIFALMAPAETPLEVRSKIAASVGKILADEAFREQYLDPYGFIPKASTPQELDEYLTQDRIIQAERIKVSGVTPD